jgi:sporulation protein YlmC with PRC-barrel domain
VLSADGTILGTVDNFVVDTKSGAVHHMLVMPDQNLDPRRYKTDSQGRLVLPFDKVKSVKDVVVMAPF